MKSYEDKMTEHYKRALRQGGGTGNFSQVICPTTYDKPCKLCTLCYEILRDKANQGTKLRDRAYELNQKHKYYSNVIFPGVNPSQVVVFEYGDKIFGKFIGYQMDPNSDYKDWTHPADGRNVFIKKIPGASKEKTSYDVTPRANKTKLVDMDVLKRLIPLDEVLQLIKAGEVKPVYQSKLEMGDTEARVLPSWLGPGSNVFYFPVSFHYGITDEEFNAIQAGDLNPFVTVIPETKSEITGGWKPVGIEPPLTAAKIVETNDKYKGGWDSLLDKTVAPLKELVKDTMEEGTKKEPVVEKGESLYPGCYGQFDPAEEECVGICAEEGWSKPCEAHTKDLLDKKSKRIAAKRLSK